MNQHHKLTNHLLYRSIETSYRVLRINEISMSLTKPEAEITMIGSRCLLNNRAAFRHVLTMRTLIIKDLSPVVNIEILLFSHSNVSRICNNQQTQQDNLQQTPLSLTWCRIELSVAELKNNTQLRRAATLTIAINHHCP